MFEMYYNGATEQMFCTDKEKAFMVKRMKRTGKTTGRNIVGLLLFIAALLILAALVFGRTSVRAEEEAKTPVYTAVSVAPGDSLWSLAEKYAPEETDIRDYIELLRELNGLRNETLRAGSSLIVVSYE